MNVRRSHWVSINRSQELIRWAIGGKRVCCWPEAVETIFSILICLKLSSKIVVALVVWILEVVFSIAACLPHIEGNVWNWLLCCQISDRAMHVCNEAFMLVLDDAVAQFPPWSVG